MAPSAEGLTSWFPRDQEPIRSGWYEVRVGKVVRFAYWNAHYDMWSAPFTTRVDTENVGIALTSAEYMWRGLIKKP